MKLDPTLPWDTLFNRVLQSWKDSAFCQARRPYFIEEPTCESCASDRYVALAMAHDPGSDEGWPHWMQHTLHELINELRTDLLIHLIERPHADGAIEDYYRGSGLIPQHRQDLATRQAVRIVHDHGTVLDLWLRHRLTNLGAWPARVRRAART
ncbi:hypothetical protein EG850_12285 [Gulosibacter macacae]|uniref:Uncharacterized protein n=1 Tax=Gulosibacter macacae TaxID=2488791 RepID=A0A3P3VTB8_9MICO|nr:hypothetical protein [Gulosibacter macacae]RRJ85694.1 hypothetical protein EG850_12285 [Gulosibacter macacae]